MSRRVTITDVAEAAGVSVATVSKVINGRWGVAAETAARVRRVVDELGYVSSLGAASLRSSTTHVLAVLVTEIEPFSAELLKGVSRTVTESGYELLVYVGGPHRSDPGWEQRYVARIAGTLADGMILVTPAAERYAAGTPLVAVDPHRGDFGARPSDATVPSVLSDNEGGARAATEHLIELGHRRIAFLGGRPDLESARRREAGFRTAMGAAGLPVDPTRVAVGSYQAEASVGPAHALLDRPDRPTAVFAANDVSAIEIMHVAAELGLRVPHDLSVVGFDDIPEASRTTPPLTTVAQPLQAMGARAAELLLDKIQARDVPAEVTLPTELVVRASTAAPPT